MELEIEQISKKDLMYVHRTLLHKRRETVLYTTRHTPLTVLSYLPYTVVLFPNAAQYLLSAPQYYAVFVLAVSTVFVFIFLTLTNKHKLPATMQSPVPRLHPSHATRRPSPIARIRHRHLHPHVCLRHSKIVLQNQPSRL